MVLVYNYFNPKTLIWSWRGDI